MKMPELLEDWKLARAARVNLLLTGIPRVNLHLIGVDGVIEKVLETLRPDLRYPISSWHPGERFVLPPVAWKGTMILRDVGALAHGDQRRLLDWLESMEGGRTQVVSTTPEPLLRHVETGRFIDSLYYRLNTICVDSTA